MEDEIRTLNLLELPEEIIEKIFSYMSFEELAHLRIVCKRFNQINQVLLNKGFRRVERYQATCLKQVKSQLPRRESERRNHPLFRHCDILTAIETRLSLLNMTFSKYVDCQMCCFIPGKVIDEIYRVLRFVQFNKTLPKSHEILTELRDISSMAMEHFEEKIVRTLKVTASSQGSPRFPLSSPLASAWADYSGVGSSPSSSSDLRSRSPGCSASSSLPSTPRSAEYLFSSTLHLRSVQVQGLKKEVSDLKMKLHELRRKVSDQERVALEQNRLLSEQTSKLISQEAKQNEMNRKLVEYEQRFTELFAELGRLKEDKSGGFGSGLSNLTKNIYNSYSVSNTPLLSSTLFVAGNMVQPKMVPLNLAAAQMPYYSPSSIAFSMGLNSLPSSSTTYSTANLNSTSKGAFITDAPSQGTSQENGENSGSRRLSTIDKASRDAPSSDTKPSKKSDKSHCKRKPSDADEGCQFSCHKKKKREDH